MAVIKTNLLLHCIIYIGTKIFLPEKKNFPNIVTRYASQDMPPILTQLIHFQRISKQTHDAKVNDLNTYTRKKLTENKTIIGQFCNFNCPSLIFQLWTIYHRKMLSK